MTAVPSLANSFALLLSCVTVGLISVSAEAVLIDLVTVGDPGNTANAIGLGAVDYTYKISKHETTLEEYAEFLNAVARDDVHGLYGFTDLAGIERNGVPGAYEYSVVPHGGDPDFWNRSPVRWINFAQAIRYANWLHNGQPIGPQGPNTTEDGAYTISPAGLTTNTIARNAGARYFIPTTDEWYKAAFYKGGGTDAGYWQYPYQHDEPPVGERPPGGENSANYRRAAAGPLFVGLYTESVGPYGTFDQGGNVREWSETIFDGEFRGAHGGSWATIDLEAISSNHVFRTIPLRNIGTRGIRIAAIPEPGSGGLVLFGIVVLILRRSGSRRAC